jgi:hypothetical protein
VCTNELSTFLYEVKKACPGRVLVLGEDSWGVDEGLYSFRPLQRNGHTNSGGDEVNG